MGGKCRLARRLSPLSAHESAGDHGTWSGRRRRSGGGHHALPWTGSWRRASTLGIRPTIEALIVLIAFGAVCAVVSARHSYARRRPRSDRRRHLAEVGRIVGLGVRGRGDLQRPCRERSPAVVPAPLRLLQRVGRRLGEERGRLGGSPPGRRCRSEGGRRRHRSPLRELVRPRPVRCPKMNGAGSSLAFRERVPELAVMKALGFKDGARRRRGARRGAGALPHGRGERRRDRARPRVAAQCIARTCRRPLSDELGRRRARPRDRCPPASARRSSRRRSPTAG